MVVRVVETESVEVDDDEDITEDERVLRLVERGLHSGIGEVTYRPLTWTRGRPDREGWRHARLPGTAQHTIVSVVKDETGELWYGVSAVAWSRVADSSLEWGSAPVQSPAGPAA